jgi:hypothetical protein
MNYEYCTRYYIKKLTEDGLLKDPKNGSFYRFNVNGYTTKQDIWNLLEEREKNDEYDDEYVILKTFQVRKEY